MPRTRTRIRTYPATPAGWTRQQRDIRNAEMAGRGHDMQWQAGHGQDWMRGVPGWTGQCGKCGDIVIVACDNPHTAWTLFAGHEGEQRRAPRRCRRRRGWYPA